MQQAVGESRFCFECMPESMAEIEERARARRLALVFGHDPGLGGDAGRDALFERRGLTCQNRGAVILQPGEEFRIAEHAVFQNLGVTGAHFAIGQRVECRQIGKHQRGLVKGTDEILARRAVDCGLAADRTVHLSQQSGRHLDEAAPAFQDGAGKAGEIAHHAATQRHNMIAALDTLFEQPVGQPLQFAPALGAFARRDVVPARGLAAHAERLFHARAPKFAGIAVGHDGNVRLAQEGRRMFRQVVHQAVPDADFVAAACQFDRDYSHASIASRMRPTVR